VQTSIAATLRRWLRALLPFVCLAGCQYDPFAHEYTASRPAESEVVGSYRPDRETSERIREQFGISVASSCELILRADGTFSISELPNCWFVSAQKDCLPGTQSVSGTSQLVRQQQWWAVRLTKHSVKHGVDHSYGLPAMLRGSEPPYILHLIIGDPDMGNGLAFAKG
jgi:hypothetical protein